MKITAAFDKLINYDVAKKFEDDLKSALEISRVDLDIKYSPDMFCTEYFTEIINFLKDSFSVVNGFFDDADITYNNESSTLDISLKNGGFALLQKAGIESALPKIIYDLFSMNVKVVFGGVLTSDKEKHEKSYYEAIANIPMPEPVIQNSAQKDSVEKEFSSFDINLAT